MDAPEGCKFTKEHEWLKSEGGNTRVGISDHAQKELGDVVFVELPEVGAQFKQGDSMATIESVKAVSDVFAPVDCEVVAVNEVLSGTPELINAEPFGQGWLATIKPLDSSQMESLMDSESYTKFVSEISN